MKFPKLSRRVWLGLAASALTAAGVSQADQIGDTTNIVLDALQGHSPSAIAAPQ